MQFTTLSCFFSLPGFAKNLEVFSLEMGSESLIGRERGRWLCSRLQLSVFVFELSTLFKL